VKGKPSREELRQLVRELFPNLPFASRPPRRITVKEAADHVMAVLDKREAKKAKP